MDVIKHKFELAGLGVAPFRFVAVENRVYRACPGAPAQPGGCCAYCGEGIMECCIIQDAHGKMFVVGNVCVNKTDDAGLVNVTKRALNKFRTEERHKREAVRIEAGRELLNRPETQEKLAGMPHPMGFASKTALDWARWMMQNAGNAGRIKVCKLLESLG